MAELFANGQAVITKCAHPRCQMGIVRGRHAPLARRHVLQRLKAERGDIAQTADATTTVDAAKRMTGILNDRDVVPSCNVVDGF